MLIELVVKIILLLAIWLGIVKIEKDCGGDKVMLNTSLQNLAN